MIALFGIPVTAYIARFCVPMAVWGWRLVFIWGSLGILFPLFAGALEESPRWYENHKRLDEADAVLDRIEKCAADEIGFLAPPPASVQRESCRLGYSELVAPAYLPTTVMLVFTWICQTLGFYGFSSWGPTLLAEHGFSIVQSLSWSSAIWLGSYTRRRHSCTYFGSLGAQVVDSCRCAAECFLCTHVQGSRFKLLRSLFLGFLSRCPITFIRRSSLHTLRSAIRPKSETPAPGLSTVLVGLRTCLDRCSSLSCLLVMATQAFSFISRPAGCWWQ